MPESNVASRISWGKRFRNSVKASLIGILLFLGAIMMLYFNESRTIDRVQALEEGARIVTPIDANHIEVSKEGKLVYLNGKVTTDASLEDDMFDIYTDRAIKLRRVVEIYQWNERKSELSETEELWGIETNTKQIYIYSQIWSDRIIDSYYFKYPEHKNPSYMHMRGKVFSAANPDTESVVKLGKFTLSPSFVAQINNYQPLQITTLKVFKQIPEPLRLQLHNKVTDVKVFSSMFHLYNGNYYVAQKPTEPQIGDLRIRFEIVPSTIISIVAKQEDSNLIPYKIETGDEFIELFGYGAVDIETLFKRAKRFKKKLTWILRPIGFFVMFLGFIMLFQVLKILATFTPWLSSIVEWSGWFVAFVLATTFSLITIAVAWLHFRTWVGVTLIVIAVVFLFFLKFARKQDISMLIPEKIVPVKRE